MSNLNKFQQWAIRRRPKVTPDVKPEPEPESTPEEDLAEAWADFKHEFRWIIRVFTTVFWISVTVVCLYAFAVVDIQRQCYLDKECKQWIERN